MTPKPSHLTTAQSSMLLIFYYNYNVVSNLTRTLSLKTMFSIVNFLVKGNIFIFFYKFSKECEGVEGVGRTIML